MKEYLKFALSILIIFGFTDLHSQVRPEYVFGLNMSTMTLKTNGINPDTRTSIGIHYGAYLEIPLTYNFTLHPGLLFSAKGSNYKIDNGESNLSPIYVEVPITVEFSFGSDVVKISLFAGPYFAYGISGYKIDSGGDLKSISYGSGGNNDLRPFDIGMNFGTGVNIKGFLISAQYGIGLTNISPMKTADSEIKNKVIGISISSLFTFK